MAEIVGAFTVPHAPLILAAPQAANRQQADSCWRSYSRVIERVRELEVDTVIVVGDDHYTLFGPHCIPAFLIGIGDVDGPAEPWINSPHARIENNEPLAHHIMDFGHETGVDWAVAKSLTVDHSIFVPWHYAIKPLEGVRTIPIYINSGVAPLVKNRRCYQVGQSIAAAIKSWQGAERVAIYASGGISHWPAEARWEELNPDFDRRMISLLETGNVEAIIALSDEEVYEEAGNGAWEIKNWLCMMGALAGWKGELIAYEAVYEWLGTCAFLEMKKAA